MVATAPGLTWNPNSTVSGGLLSELGLLKGRERTPTTTPRTAVGVKMFQANARNRYKNTYSAGCTWSNFQSDTNFSGDRPVGNSCCIPFCVPRCSGDGLHPGSPTRRFQL